MAGELDGYDDRSRLRISDADRHRVAELLREAAGEGRLDIEELDERLEAAYVAKTYGGPGPAHGRPAAGCDPAPARVRPRRACPGSRPPATTAPSRSWAAPAARACGRWDPTHTAFALMGGVDIDLRQARFTSRETVIHAYAIWCGIDIYVNAQTQVIVDGVGIMGAFDRLGTR